MSSVHENNRDEEKPTTDHVNMAAPTESDLDVEAPDARGVDLEDIPPQYWWSFRFLGSAISIILLAICLYVGFSLPVSFHISSWLELPR